MVLAARSMSTRISSRRVERNEEHIESCYLVNEGLAAAWRSQMADLHQTTRNPDPNAGIDAVGWLFSAVAALIIAVAGLIAYEANDTRLANAPVPQIAAR